MSIETVLVTTLAVPVLLRIGRIAAQLQRKRFGCAWRFQFFASGYALLGALTLQLLVDTWSGQPIPLASLGFLAASALLITFDRRT